MTLRGISNSQFCRKSSKSKCGSPKRNQPYLFGRGLEFPPQIRYLLPVFVLPFPRSLKGPMLYYEKKNGILSSGSLLSPSGHGYSSAASVFFSFSAVFIHHTRPPLIIIKSSLLNAGVSPTFPFGRRPRFLFSYFTFRK